MDRYGLDTWRQKFPDDPGFTWSTSIDYWLVSKDLNQEDISISTHPTPLTDHKAILIRINICALEREIARTSYWKLNSSYLKIEHVKTEINRLLEYFLKKATVEQSFCKNWELFKNECAKFLRSYGSMCWARRVEEDNIIAHISSIIEKGIENFTEEDQLKLTESQNKLDDIYRRKAEGAFARSRKKWLEEGEQNSSYFFLLEKQLQITILYINLILMVRLPLTLS